MKKIVKYLSILVMALVCLIPTKNTNAQPDPKVDGNGFLKKKFYGTMDLTEMRQALLGEKMEKSSVLNISQENLVAFHKRNIAKIFSYTNKSYEEIIRGARETDGSNVKDFQSEYMVGFVNADRTDYALFPRGIRPGEMFLEYDGIIFASSFCWNIVEKIKKPTPNGGGQLAQNGNGNNQQGGGDQNQPGNGNGGGNQQPSGSSCCNGSNTSLDSYRLGQMDMQAYEDHSTLRNIALIKAVATTTPSTTTTTEIRYVNAGQNGGGNNGGNNNGGGGGNNNGVVTYKQQPNATDVINTVANVAQTGIYLWNTIRMNRMYNSGGIGYYGGGAYDYSGGPNSGERIFVDVDNYNYITNQTTRPRESVSRPTNTWGQGGPNVVVVPQGNSGSFPRTPVVNPGNTGNPGNTWPAGGRRRG